MNIFKPLIGCALILVMIAAQAHAVLITPVSVIASSQFNPSVNLINGLGLDGVGPILGQLHDNDENNMWTTFGGPVGEWVEFEFDKVYNLSVAHIWQFNGLKGGNAAPHRAVKDLDISISQDLVSSFISLGTEMLNPALNPLSGPIPDFNEPVQSFGLGGANIARRVRITILSLYDPTNSDGIAGLSEVRFAGRATAVPEPTTIALLGIGLVGLAGAEVRRRREKKVIDKN